MSYEAYTEFQRNIVELFTTKEREFDVSGGGDEPCKYLHNLVGI